MDLTYQRQFYRADGIGSEVTETESGAHFMVVLEHAYLDEQLNTYLPILQPGTYDCVRGAHRLDGMTEDFITFEITGVKDQHGTLHHGILFHWGNWNNDSKGCSLCGEKFAFGDDPRVVGYSLDDMVTNSRATFARFMQSQEGLDRFTLTVKA